MSQLNLPIADLWQKLFLTNSGYLQLGVWRFLDTCEELLNVVLHIGVISSGCDGWNLDLAFSKFHGTKFHCEMQVLSEENQRRVLQFVRDEGLILLADEVCLLPWELESYILYHSQHKSFNSGSILFSVTKTTASVHQNPQHCHYMQIGSLLTLMFGIKAGDVRDWCWGFYICRSIKRTFMRQGKSFTLLKRCHGLWVLERRTLLLSHTTQFPKVIKLFSTFFVPSSTKESWVVPDFVC